MASKCDHCGNVCSPSAKVCPHCGDPNPFAITGMRCLFQFTLLCGIAIGALTLIFGGIILLANLLDVPPSTDDVLTESADDQSEVASSSTEVRNLEVTVSPVPAIVDEHTDKPHRPVDDNSSSNPLLDDELVELTVRTDAGVSRTYKNVRILEVEADSIRIIHSSGSTRIDFSNLPQDIRDQLNQ